MSAHNTTASLSARNSRTLQIGTIPNMAPAMTRTNSNKSTHSIQDVEHKNAPRTVDEGRPSNPLVRLEETFTAYVAALQSRKGNILARSLRNRAAADELAVNALYNTFIEKPFDTRTASESTVDVLFVAFEKFLRLGWQDQMGQVMSLQTLDALQENALKMHPGDFFDYVRMIFSEMAPQNRRAFIAIVKLLADLLDGCGNDGDRGALTATFAELLVVEGQPHAYINLLDRVVAESERLFEDIGPGAAVGFGGSQGSVNSRSNHSAPGSLNFKGSSLRSRFDTLLRQNSKTDDSRPSVWRSLSKTGRNVATGDPSSSLSKGTLARSRSIESSHRRPASRDRPTVMGAFDERPLSSHGGGSRLSTIGASPPPEEKEQEKKTLKTKRRSSLSDLKAMMAAASLGGSPGMSPPSEKKALPVLKFNTSPRTPSPTKIPMAGGIMDRNRSSMYTGSPNQKENTPLNSPRNIGNLTERPQNIMSTPDSVTVKELWSPKSHNKTISLNSNIPTLRNTTHGCTPSTATSRPTSSPTKNSPQKFRLQSPQKLRERIQNEAKAINEAEASLQSELSKIGEEMARLTGPSSSSLHRSTTTELTALRSTISSLETRLPTLITDLTARNEAIKSDLESSLQASEYKIKGLDQLCKEASAENELLYEKFNGELGKIVKALKGKGKEDREDLVKAVKEAGEREVSARKEVGRLKREVLGLRGLLKGSSRGGGGEVELGKEASPGKAKMSGM